MKRRASGRPRIAGVTTTGQRAAAGGSRPRGRSLLHPVNIVNAVLILGIPVMMIVLFGAAFDWWN